MSVEFDTPANRIIQQFEPKNQFRIDTSLPDLAFLRQLSIQGRLRFKIDVVVNTTATSVFTPADGETIFIYAYRYQHTGSGSSTVSFVNNEQTRDVGLVDAGLPPITVNLMDSLVGDGTKTIGLNIIAATGTARTSLFGWSENTSRIRDVET